LKLFRFANKGDVLLMVVGSICSIIMGAFIPIFALLTGNMIDAFGTSEIYDEAKKNLFNYLYLGVAALVIGTTMFSGWMIAGERQGARCRREYFQSLLKQEIGWFDCQKQAAISTTF
jgi:ATP-binding cassette, subfamily B (MDR/TAP), member 1